MSAPTTQAGSGATWFVVERDGAFFVDSADAQAAGHCIAVPQGPDALQIARLIAAAQQMLEALKRLCGTADDPNNGWRGQGTNELFGCEYCGAKHVDCTQIEHGISCPIPEAHAAISAATGGRS